MDYDNVVVTCTFCGASAGPRENILFHYPGCEYVAQQERTWHADGSDKDSDCVRIHRGNFQVAKMPKHGTDYAEYWPGPKTLQWMLNAMNEYEKTHPLAHSVNE